ncbi:MAG: DUF664 domain-containing protein [Armatimonadetes bacterium]|nr:DUF664 domain-containing protein [Armatimonadota bacterium]
MTILPEIRDMQALTGKYHLRLRELVGQVPEAALHERVGGAGLSVVETVRHVCEAERSYMNLIDGGERQTPEPPPDVDGLLRALAEAEAEMGAFLETMDEATLATTRDVPGWWGEGEPRSARLILMHSLAHKYYHCGQLQAVLHALDARERTP